VLQGVHITTQVGEADCKKLNCLTDRRFPTEKIMGGQNFDVALKFDHDERFSSFSVTTAL